MKTRHAAAVVTLLVIGGLAAAEHHEAKDAAEPGGKLRWFDAERCTICRPMAEAEDLMQGMEWETHKIDNGMVMVSVIPAENLDRFRAACSQMEELAELVAAGKIKGARCCGFCEAFGDLKAAGVKMQKIDAGFGHIVIVTSDDSAMVEKVHAMADRTVEEMEKMAAAGY